MIGMFYFLRKVDLLLNIIVEVKDIYFVFRWNTLLYCNTPLRGQNCHFDLPWYFSNKIIVINNDNK